jgi:RNA polymerase sigma-70 factor (ECF subfamily)
MSASTTSVPTTSDAALIRQYQQGSREAFNVLYARHLPAVFKRVRYVVPVEDVEDVTQEVFIAALHSLDSFRGEAQFSTWLRTLTNNKVAEYYRKRNRKKEAPQTPLLESQARVESSAHSSEEQILLQRALNQLPADYREVLLLRFAEGCQFHEIAVLTGQNLEATKSLFRRAITRLRSLLEESI